MRSVANWTLEQKLCKYTESSVKRRDPGIQQLARKYNTIIDAMHKLKSEGRAPKQTIAPHKIDMDKLFCLDVNDDIWQDIGLDLDDLDASGVPPLWLCNEDVREGIKAMLESDHCKEEGDQLLHE